MTKTVQLDEATFNALVAALQAAGASLAPTPAPSPTPAPAPAPQPSAVTLPPELAGRSRMEVTLPWSPWVSNTFNRRVSSRPLDDTNVFIGYFKTGAAQRDVRLQAAEYPSPTVKRNGMLVRLRDGAVLARPTGTTLTLVMTFDTAPQPTGFLAPPPKPVLEANTEYALVISNVPGSNASTMLMELYL